MTAAVAADYRLPVLPNPPATGVYLYLTPNCLELRLAGAEMRPLFVDLSATDIQRRAAAGHRSSLARALGLHRRPRQTILDATCGLARDAGVLLALGCNLIACERSPTLHALLRDGLTRAAAAPAAADWLARWRGLFYGDAVQWLARHPSTGIDTIYIDPMFGLAGRHALPKRSAQILQLAVGDDGDAARLLAAARAADAARVVVKRHPRQPPLAVPDYSLDGRRISFDIYLGRD